MDEIDHVVSFIVQPQRSFGEKIPSTPLDGALKYRTTNKLVTAPLASKSVLAADGDTILDGAPRGQLSFDFG